MSIILWFFCAMRIYFVFLFLFWCLIFTLCMVEIYFTYVRAKVFHFFGIFIYLDSCWWGKEVRQGMRWPFFNSDPNVENEWRLIIPNQKDSSIQWWNSNWNIFTVAPNIKQFLYEKKTKNYDDINNITCHVFLSREIFSVTSILWSWIH